MEKRMVRVLLGLLALLFCAGQALAVPAAPATLYMPPSPDVDGVYKIVWSPVSGCNYVLQESKDGGAWATIFSGSNTYIYPPKRALGTYAYQVKAVNSTGSSLWKAGATTVTVGATTAQTTAPTYLNVPAATSTSATKITFGGAALNASYVLEQAIGTSPTFTVVYTGSNGYYYTVGLVDGTTYAYRVKAKVAGYADSNYYPGTTGSTLAVTLPQGAAACISCHNPATTDPAAPTAANALAVGPDWTAGRHANANQKPGPGVCDNCHNVNNVAGAAVAQITCQACHGAVGHPTTVSAAITVCAQCHNSHVSAVGNIVTKVNGGKHAIAANTHTNSSCLKCHSVEGNLAFRAGLAIPASGPSGPSCVVCHDSHTAALRDPQYTLCTSCHQTAAFYHDGSWSRNIMTTHNDDATTGVTYDSVNNKDVQAGASTIIEGYVLRTSQANPCLDCHGHEFLTETGNLKRTPFAGVNALGVATTYYGYLKDANHELTLHTEWAQSGHAGKLLAQKYAAQEAYPKKNVVDGMGNVLATGTYDFAAGMTTAVKAVGVTGTTGAAWEHYNWDRTGRAGCQKCHTATGAANYLDNPAGYVAANNNFAHLANWSTDPAVGSVQNEVLYCWGCHTSVETGALRAPGAIKADYKFKPLVGSSALAQFTDVGASNVCIACHAGQASGASVVALTTASNAFNNVSFVNSHYMAAGGLVYAKIGYTNFVDPATVIGTSTYGKSLTTPEDGGLLTSTHRKLGTPAMATDSHVGGQGLVSGGPCVTCHYAAGSHTLEMDAAAFNNVCVKCHDEEAGVPLTAANFKTIFIEEQAVPFDNALALALAQLKAKYNISYNQALYPYFYDDNLVPVGAVKDWTRGGALSAADAEKLMGACFNINLLSRDPAAYVHARTYTRRLIYDSIDFLDDKNMNMSTGATAIAWDPIKYIKDATAGGTTTESFKYLAGYDRTTLVWRALERP